MTRSELVDFIRRHRLGVVATASAGGAPQAAVVGVAVTDDLELVFDTLGGSRKAANLRRDARVAVVIGWDDEQTVQCEGVADEPAGPELARLQQCYFAAFPDGPSRLAWPGITYVRVRPTWIRYSDFRKPETVIVELGADELRALSAV
jgi:PPOX class probable F420-dependent enzyme